MISDRSAQTSPATTPFTFDAGILSEPVLLFGGGQEHVDPKRGLALFGPYSPGAQLRPPMSTIRVGIVGPSNMISDTERWLETCHRRVCNTGKEPLLAPHFPGINQGPPFHCEIAYGAFMRSIITDNELNTALSEANYLERVRRVIQAYVRGMETLVSRDPRPDVTLCCIPRRVIDECTTRRLRSGEVKRTRVPKSERDALKKAASGQLYLLPELDPTRPIDDVHWEHSDIRRGIKVHGMHLGLPTQLVWPRAISLDADTSNDPRESAEDIATRAWNFVTALYYKAGSIPWRLRFPDPTTCFVGISFYRERKHADGLLRTAMAQTFTSSGDGYVLRGGTVEIDKTREKNRSPHMDRATAKALMELVVSFYRRQNNDAAPSRVVIHKSSRYWPEELAGLREGCTIVPRIDLVALGWRNIQFYRPGMYPPIRGTYVKFSEQNQLLYTVGYVPLQRTYDGPRVPQPIEILEHYGDTPWLDVLTEVLSLTKLNWNSADFACGEPITLRFARRVGDILSELGDNTWMRNEYRFYM